MNKLIFKILNLSFESENNYIDEGFVKSISDKTNELFQRYDPGNQATVHYSGCYKKCNNIIYHSLIQSFN